MKEIPRLVICLPNYVVAKTWNKCWETDTGTVDIFVISKYIKTFNFHDNHFVYKCDLKPKPL